LAASIDKVLSHVTAWLPSHRSVAETIVVVAKRQRSKNTFFIIVVVLELILFFVAAKLVSKYNKYCQ
jgi:hypothetical protein